MNKLEELHLLIEATESEIYHKSLIVDALEYHRNYLMEREREGS